MGVAYEVMQRVVVVVLAATVLPFYVRFVHWMGSVIVRHLPHWAAKLLGKHLYTSNIDDNRGYDLVAMARNASARKAGKPLSGDLMPKEK